MRQKLGQKLGQNEGKKCVFCENSKMAIEGIFKRFKRLLPFWGILVSKIGEVSFPVVARDTEPFFFNIKCEEFNR